MGLFMMYRMDTRKMLFFGPSLKKFWRNIIREVTAFKYDFAFDYFAHKKFINICMWNLLIFVAIFNFSRFEFLRD